MCFFEEITPEKAWFLMNSENAVLLDMRDMNRFNHSHPQGAFHLTDQSYIEFEQEYDYEHPAIVMCYRGIGSRNIANFLCDQGYERVYSLIGGFEGWLKANLPIESDHI
ncbi:thiosulfate sulfurtransferase [Bisgaardia hudsonensis]|uniref:Thiosulfate sulfurtransferase GlpE n=1 Tax=Bisgaardia hudsonensis TaxID=109472 RepID=A0A4R2MVL6_9PAST|nr:thiosulfate sulfurtransferase [Bisgaardia hudsonensis]TCP12371.1 thiosulfate sulfurtransferase [Bisgaardia hudsonensis]